MFRGNRLGVKLNAVALKGFNEDELFAITEWCASRDMDLTWIEVMPMGDIGNEDRLDQYWKLTDLRARLAEQYTLTDLPLSTGGPARYVRLEETGQKVGFITPLTHNFCESCNRVRLTCTGTLYMCLGQNDKADLRFPLRVTGDESLLDAAIDEAALRTRRAEAQLAEQEFKRVSDLLPKRAVSQSQYDEAKANFDAARARVNEAEAQLSKKIIRAPFDGKLGLRLVDQGEYIGTGTPIVEINMLDPIYVDYTLSEKDLPMVQQGYDVVATVAAIPDSHFAGQVSAINTSVNPQTRTVRIRATLGNEDNQLRPGMFATVATRQPQDREVVTVPRTAVSYNTYGDFVFVVEENDDGELVVNRRTIQTGNTRDSRVAVLDGLKEGEQVVSKGLLRLRAGQRVEVQEDEQPAEASK